MTINATKALSFAAAIAVSATAAFAMDNERELVGHNVQLDKEMMMIFEMVDADKDGSVTAEEVSKHQEMMNKFIMMVLENNRR